MTKIFFSCDFFRILRVRRLATYFAKNDCMLRTLSLFYYIRIEVNRETVTRLLTIAHDRRQLYELGARLAKDYLS